MHFYETFLAAYDRSCARAGAYFTPSPVASYIVRSVDALLRTYFKCPRGSADGTQVEIDNLGRAAGQGQASPPKKIEVDRVLLLDPATGTATFPYAVIDDIRGCFMQSGNAASGRATCAEHLPAALWLRTADGPVRGRALRAGTPTGRPGSPGGAAQGVGLRLPGGRAGGRLPEQHAGRPARTHRPAPLHPIPGARDRRSRPHQAACPCW